MRFSTLFAFILPLSALAAPSLVKRAPAANDNALNAERKVFANALLEMKSALQAFTDSSVGLPQQQIQKLLGEVSGAQNKTNTAIDAGERILGAVQGNQEPNRAEYVNTFISVACTSDGNNNTVFCSCSQQIITDNVLEVNNIISAFKTKFQDRTSGFGGDLQQPQHDALGKLIKTAADKAGAVKASGFKILMIEGLNLPTLGH